MYNNDEANVVHRIGQREREAIRHTHTQTHAHWLLQYKVELGEFYFSIIGTKTYFYIFCFLVTIFVNFPRLQQITLMVILPYCHASI